MVFATSLGLPVPELPDFVVVEVENAREVQLRDLRDHGIYLRLETGVAKHYMVDLLMNGDMLFQSASKGHAGSSAKYFSIYRLCNREHVQNGHR